MNLTHRSQQVWRWLARQLNWQSKIRNKLLLMILVFTALPFGLFAGIAIQKGSAYIALETEKQNQEQADQLAAFIDYYINDQLARVKQTVAFWTKADFASASASNENLSFLISRFPNHSALSVIDVYGHPLGAKTRLPWTQLPNLTQNHWKVPPAVVDRDLKIGVAQYYEALQELAVPIKIPIVDPAKKQVELLLTVYFSLDDLKYQLWKWFGPDTEIILVNKEGEIIFHPRLSVSGKRLSPAFQRVHQELSQKQPLPGQGGDRFLFRNDLGKRVLRAYSHCPTLGWGIFVEQNAEVLHRRVDEMRWILLAFLFLALLFSITGELWFIARMVKPFEELEAGIKLLETGLFSEPLPVHSQDEIGRLTQTFNQMAQTLLARNEEIRNKTRKLTVFNEITRIVNQSVDLHAILDKSLDKILQLLNTPIGWIHVYDPQYQRLNLISQLGMPEAGKHYFKQLELGDDPVSRAYRTGKSGLLRELPSALTTQGLPLDKFKELFMIPLRAKSRIMGVMTIVSQRKYFFHYQDLDLLTRIGDELGVAVENALLYIELQAKVKELEDVNQDLQELDRFKNRILSNVSHELRTPITSMRTYVDLFLQDKIGHLDDAQRDKLQIVQRNILHLLNLINDLLTLARIEDQKIHLKNMEVMVLQNVVDMVIADTIEMARAKGLSLSRRGELHPILVRVNRQRIHQVFQNLVSNAIKFTEQGTITLDLKVVPAPRPAPLTEGELPPAPEENRVEVSVTDTGIGIPKKALTKIFQRFYQIDSSSTRKYVGTGLGLAIVKEILEAHHTEIFVESKVGQGSRFWFHLPILSVSDLSQLPAEVPADY